MARGQSEHARLPDRAGPIEVVGTPLQGEGRAVGVQARAAIAFGGIAAEAGGHRRRPVEAAVGRCGYRRRCRRDVLQGEADGAAGERIADFVGGRRSCRIRAVAL